MDKYTHKNQKEQRKESSAASDVYKRQTQKSVNPQKDTLSYLKQ